MAVRFDSNTIFRVQQATDIIDVISEHIRLSKKGKEMVGLCPFHEDHRPSLYVNPAKQIFKCFACGAGGDVFKFIQMRENLNFGQAVERLGRRAGIEIKPLKTTKTQTQKPDVDPNRLAKANNWAAEYFHKNLLDKKKGKSARDYLKQRKINTETIKKWRLGLAIEGNDLFKTAKSQKADTNLLIKAGLLTPQNQDKFVNRLIFPIADVTGRVIGLGGRTLDGADAKYINSPATVLFDKSNSIYGLQHARHRIVSTDTAVVVEGYTDVIMAHQFGCDNVVASLGTSFTTGHGRLLRRYAKKAVLLYDGDTAGLAAADRALEVCLSQRIDIRIAVLEKSKDPCDFLLENGKEGFEKLIAGAVDVFEFKWNRLNKKLDDSETIAGKKQAVEQYLEAIAKAVYAGTLPEIEKGLIVNRLSKLIGLDSKQINAELSKKVRTTARTTTYNQENRKVQRISLGASLNTGAQREILEVLLCEPNLFELVKGKITADMFDEPILNQISTALFETLESKNFGSENLLTKVLAKIESTGAGSLVVKLADTGRRKGNFHRRLDGAIEAMQRYRARLQAADITAVEDKRRYLRKVLENTGKENRHNIGMI